MTLEELAIAPPIVDASPVAPESGRIQPLLVLGSLAFSIAFVALAVTAWGWDDWTGFFRNPARAGVCVGMVALFAGTFWLGCNVSPGATDRSANNWIFLPMFLAGLALGWFPASGDRHDHWVFGGNGVRCLGLITFWAGTVIRLAAVRTLGPRHSVWVAIQNNHQLVTGGVYRFIRHPSYLGALMTVFGWAIAFRSGAGLLLGLLMIPPIVSRMTAEEHLLVARFAGEYTSYRQRTWRVLPWVY